MKITFALLAAALLVGCENSPIQANGGHENPGHENPGPGTTPPGEPMGFPNDGSVGGDIQEGGTSVFGDFTDNGPKFRCTELSGNAVEAVLSGVVGDVGGIVSQLGGQSVTDLLNSVEDPTAVADGDLGTAATFTQTAAGVAGVLDEIVLDVNMAELQAPGDYAVFAVSFPESLLDVGLLSTVSVETLIDEEVVESGVALDGTGLSLLGFSTDGRVFAWLGYRTILPWSTARLRVSSNLLSVDIGDALKAHDLCTKGRLVVERHS